MPGSDSRFSSPKYSCSIYLKEFFLWNFVIGRLWLDSKNRVYLIKKLDKRIGQAQLAILVNDILKIIVCR
ncbi:unnamed protein product, partial [Vitis vinifera]|uniref:Uncharacterized protein n=1 Tax=Vitis vinifera TaxID=29760 RepID=D7TMM5_VITVI